MKVILSPTADKGLAASKFFPGPTSTNKTLENSFNWTYKKVHCTEVEQNIEKEMDLISQPWGSPYLACLNTEQNSSRAPQTGWVCSPHWTSLERRQRCDGRLWLKCAAAMHCAVVLSHTHCSLSHAVMPRPADETETTMIQNLDDVRTSCKHFQNLHDLLKPWWRTWESDFYVLRHFASLNRTGFQETTCEILKFDQEKLPEVKQSVFSLSASSELLKFWFWVNSRKSNLHFL